MNTVVCGDVHGKTERFMRIVNQAEAAGLAVIQVGDMGLGFRGTLLPHLGKQHGFIRGNHDGPDECRMHPNYMGDYGFDLARNLFWLAGAYSIDYEWRQNRERGGGDKVWWDDEELSQDKLDKAFDLYSQSKPRVVVSHECPASVAKEMIGPLLITPSYGHADTYYSAKLGCTGSRTARMLEQMFERHQPEAWIFGHYHMDWEKQINGTRFVCRAELSTIEIEL